MESTLRPRNLNFDLRAAQEDTIQIRMLLETMGALAQGMPLATIIKQAQDLANQAKQHLDAKTTTPSKLARSQSCNRNAHPERSKRSVGNCYNAPPSGWDVKPELDANQRNWDAQTMLNTNRAQHYGTKPRLLVTDYCVFAPNLRRVV